jgi:hypothetical protein
MRTVDGRDEEDPVADGGADGLDGLDYWTNCSMEIVFRKGD